MYFASRFLRFVCSPDTLRQHNVKHRETSSEWSRSGLQETGCLGVMSSCMDRILSWRRFSHQLMADGRFRWHTCPRTVRRQPAHFAVFLGVCLTRHGHSYTRTHMRACICLCMSVHRRICLQKLFVSQNSVYLITLFVTV